MKISNFSKPVILLVFFFSVVGSRSYSQETKPTAMFRSALAEYKLLRYASAAKQFNEVLRLDSNNVAALEMVAESNRKIKNYDEALYWYNRLLKEPDRKPEWVLYQAEALANKEQYEQSEKAYRNYQTLVPADKRASNFVKNEASIAGLAEDKGDWKITYTNLNTAGSEYSPVFYKKGVIFSSNRQIGRVSKDVFGWDQTPFTDLYYVDDLNRIGEVTNLDMAEIESSKSKNAYKLNDDDTEQASNDSKTLGQFNPKIVLDVIGAKLAGEVDAKRLTKRINSKYHEGAPAILPEGSIMFTRNNFYRGKVNKSRQGVNKLKLFTASGPNWTHIDAFPYNNDEYSVGHPAVTKDGSVLVFVSDMPGGFGGTDLYYSVRTSSGRSWGRPVNLGSKINTEGNEQFPYFDKTGKLYFSSTGFAGLGGLDIFEISLKDMKPVDIPHNLGAPLNSPFDDFGFIKADDERSGFFSSNRGGNDDIYKFERKSYKVDLRGLITDVKTRLPIPDANVFLRYFDGVDTLITNRTGNVFKDLKRETDYEIVAQKPGYVSASTFISTAGIEKDSTINVPLKLGRAEVNQQWVMSNCDSLKRVFAVQSIYYDLDKYYIRQDAYPALDHLASLMRKYPEIEIITASHTDSRASETYNKKLSLQRGQAAKTYLMAKGIAPGRVSVQYFGKSRLVNRCLDGVPCSEAEQQLNRRTQFDVILNGVNLNQLDCNN